MAHLEREGQTARESNRSKVEGGCRDRYEPGRDWKRSLFWVPKVSEYRLRMRFAAHAGRGRSAGTIHSHL